MGPALRRAPEHRDRDVYQSECEIRPDEDAHRLCPLHRRLPVLGRDRALQP